MARVTRGIQAIRSAISREINRLYRTQITPAFCEALEDRTLFNAGGGWSGSGIYGEYFPTGTQSGTPTFTRTDDRIDFTAGTTLAPGGGVSTDPVYGAIKANTTFSVLWDATLIPKFTEVYTLSEMIQSGDTGTVMFGTGAEGSNPTIMTGSGTQTAAVTLTAGTSYNLEMTYVHNAGSTWQAQLHWSSNGSAPFAEEAIEPGTQVGANTSQLDAADFANGAMPASEYYGGDSYGPIDVIGTLTSGSATISHVSSLSHVAVGQYIDAAGTPAGTTIASINTTTSTIVMSNASTYTGGDPQIVVDAGPPLNSNGWPTGDFFLSQIGSSEDRGVEQITFSGSATLYSNGSADPATQSYTEVGGANDFLIGYNDGARPSIHGSVTAGSTIVTSVSTSGPLLPGENISGAGIAAGTTISQLNYTGNETSGNPTVTSVSQTSNLFVGESVSASGLPGGTTIVSISSGTIVLSANPTVTATGATFVIGSQTIFLSQNATATTGSSALSVSLTIDGHTYYNYGNTISTSAMTFDSTTGTGYDPLHNTTTVLYYTTGYQNVGFSGTSQNGYGAPGSTATATTGAGVSNLQILMPTSLNQPFSAISDYASGSIFSTPFLQAQEPYTALRVYEWQNTAYAEDTLGSANYTDWSAAPNPNGIWSPTPTPRSPPGRGMKSPGHMISRLQMNPERMSTSICPAPPAARPPIAARRSPAATFTSLPSCLRTEPRSTASLIRGCSPISTSISNTATRTGMGFHTRRLTSTCTTWHWRKMPIMLTGRPMSPWVGAPSA